MRLFSNGMCITAAGQPDPTVDPSDPALLQAAGMLSPAQVADLIGLGAVTVNVLQALLAALATIATQIDTAAATEDDLAVVAAACNCVGAVRAEVALRDATATRSRTDAQAMVASIQSAVATGTTVASRLPRISQLAARQPGRTRPQFVTTSAPLVASAGGHAIDVDRVAEAVAEGVRQQYAGRSRWSGDRVTLLSLTAEAPESRRLSMDDVGNAEKIAAVTSPEALVASGGICGPVGVSYDLQAIATAGRPLQGAMAGFQATRGGLRYTTPATLAQVTADGPAAIWTAATDAAPGGATKPHAVFACQPVLEATVDAITSVTQFGNFSARFFPEQMAEFMVTANAVHARLAESNALAQLSAGSTQVTAGAYEVGAARELLSILDRAVSQMRYRHRMAPQTPLRFVEPLWLRDMLRSDLARNLPGDSGGQSERLAVADAEIEKFFSVRNVNVTDVQDSPLGATVTQGWGAQGAGQLLPWPATVATWLYPEGSWLFLDGGTLDLGMVRDSILNSTNAFQMFSETFEKSIFIGHESQQLNLHIAPTGASIGTVAPPSEPVETIGS